jgi:serine/threonine protein kinase
VPVGTFAAIMASISLLIAIQIGWCFLTYRRRKNDEMWHVNPEELNFSHPVEVIGQGAFGVVLAAEYRGTRVAIKRVIPQQDNTRTKGGSVVSVVGSAVSNPSLSPDRGATIDSEIGAHSPMTSETASPMTNSREASEDADLSDFLGGLPVGTKKTMLRRWLPFLFRDDLARSNLNLLGTASGSASTKSLYARLFPKCDETSRRQQEFMVEMRLLSRLRHPCKFQPFLYQLNPFLDSFLRRQNHYRHHDDHGSGHDWYRADDGHGVHGKWVTVSQITQLCRANDFDLFYQPCFASFRFHDRYDLLRNETLYTGGEIIMQIVRDVAQGLRFLHASKPPILHGDLKAKNILIDSRFRAKVADFGLATKNKSGLSGTPFW